MVLEGVDCINFVWNRVCWQTHINKINKPSVSIKRGEFLDIRGFVHYSTIHAEKSNKMQRCIKIYYSIFI